MNIDNLEELIVDARLATHAVKGARQNITHINERIAALQEQRVELVNRLSELEAREKNVTYALDYALEREINS